MPTPSPVRRGSLATVSLDRISLDTWAVLLALTAALLVRFGVIKTIPW